MTFDPDRKRVRRACKPCKVRKRRCNGEEPCSVCTRLEDDCYYESRPRKRQRKSIDLQPQHNGIPTLPSAAPAISSEALEADSAIALPSRLEQRLNPATSLKGQSLAIWNLGVTQTPSSRETCGECSGIFDVNESGGISSQFFATIGALYQFIDTEPFNECVRRRSQNRKQSLIDPVLYGVVLLSTYFAEHGTANRRTAALYELLDIQISKYTTLDGPTLEVGAACVLKTLFLRSTGTAYATWRASCESVHALETISPDEPCPPYISREQLFWTAHMLQATIAKETGRLPLTLFSSEAVQAVRFPEWPLFQLFQTYSLYTASPKPEQAQLEQCIEALTATQIYDDVVQLTQTSLILSTFRRLRLNTENVSRGTIRLVNTSGLAMLAAVKRLLILKQPWWTIVVVPFTYLCTLLVIDCPISLARIPETIDVLELVAQTFPSASTSAAYDRAQRMVQLLKQRKQNEIDILDRKVRIASEARCSVEDLPVKAPQSSTGPWGSTELEDTKFENFEWLSFDDEMFTFLEQSSGKLAQARLAE